MAKLATEPNFFRVLICPKSMPVKGLQQNTQWPEAHEPAKVQITLQTLKQSCAQSEWASSAVERSPHLEFSHLRKTLAILEDNDTNGEEELQAL